jgi:hypothetical protein
MFPLAWIIDCGVHFRFWPLADVARRQNDRSYPKADVRPSNVMEYRAQPIRFATKVSQLPKADMRACQLRPTLHSKTHDFFVSQPTDKVLPITLSVDRLTPFGMKPYQLPN